MRTSDFFYELPPEHIAQRPAEPRDSSRLLVYQRSTGKIQHKIFRDLPALLNPEDALVLNETRVIPARLHAQKVPTGGKAEILLLRRLAPQTWEAMVGGRGLKPGRRMQVIGGPEAEILEDAGRSRRVIQFSAPLTPQLDQVGEMPLPPYIHTPLERAEQYQTIFATTPGSSAAPTAGLHFTSELLEKIKAKGVQVIKVTLHVGLDTFAPVTEDDPTQHQIHTEWCQVSSQAASHLNQVHANGGRIITVGTTSTRTLETSAQVAPTGERVTEFEGSTDLFILPGYQFKATDAMITNFHLPRSTLLMMISAFAGREEVLKLYTIAMQNNYRFYSFGDAMLLL